MMQLTICDMFYNFVAFIYAKLINTTSIQSLFACNMGICPCPKTTNNLFWFWFGLRLYVPVNNFSIMSGRSHRFLGITSTFWGGKCILLKDTTR